MKKLRKNVRRNGCRALASLMIASSLVGMASPALAKAPEKEEVTDLVPNEIEQEGVINEDNNVAVNSDDSANESSVAQVENNDAKDENKESVNSDDNADNKDADVKDDNNDAKPEDSANDDTKKDVDSNTNTEKDDKQTNESDKAKQEEEQKKKEEEQKKKDEEYKKQIEDLKKSTSDELGKSLGEETANILKGKYETVEDALGAVSASALKGLNEGFVKNIPYGGGFAYSLIKTLLEDPTKQTDIEQLKDCFEKLNQTINSCTNALIKKTSVTNEGDYIKAINQSISNLKDEYYLKNTDLKTAIENFSEDSTDYSTILEMFYTSEYGKNVKDTNSYLRRFRTFVENILGSQTVCDSTENGGQMNVYILSDDVAMDGKKHIMESYDKRVQLVKDLKNIFGEGNSALSLAMQADQKKVTAMLAYCNYKIADLKYQVINTTDTTEKAKLQKEIDEYNKTLDHYKFRKGRVDSDLKNLNQMVIDFKQITQTQEENIENNKKDFENNKPSETIFAAGSPFNAIEVKKSIKLDNGTYKTETVKAYPFYNKKDNKVEYKDAYGYVCATKSCKNVQAKNIDTTDIVKGEKYLLFSAQSDTSFDLDSEKGTITVTNKYEKATICNTIGNVAKSIFNWLTHRKDNYTYTSTFIDYIDEKGKEYKEVNVSTLSKWKLIRNEMTDDIEYEEGYQEA